MKAKKQKVDWKQLFEKSFELNNQLLDFNSRLISALRRKGIENEIECRAKMQAYSFIFASNSWREFKLYSEQTSDTPGEHFHKFIIDKLTKELQALEDAS